jgi:hypothetical protein
MTKKKYWGKGRFMGWKDAALAELSHRPDGLSAEALLTIVKMNKTRTPSGVRQVTELLKRDNRFDAYYPAKSMKSLTGQHYRVLQWTVSEDEE